MDGVDIVRRDEEFHRLVAISSPPELTSPPKQCFHRINFSAPLNFKGREFFP